MIENSIKCCELHLVCIVLPSIRVLKSIKTIESELTTNQPISIGFDNIVQISAGADGGPRSRVLAPGSAHARPSARPPIDTSGNFSAHMSGGGEIV